MSTAMHAARSLQAQVIMTNDNNASQVCSVCGGFRRVVTAPTAMQPLHTSFCHGGQLQRYPHCNRDKNTAQNILILRSIVPLGQERPTVYHDAQSPSPSIQSPVAGSSRAAGG